ncbi:MAG: sulfotransferase family 2 domain-containing protein [Candidatus Marinimicrobia bacterium]|nr:sulfotransferase family 2 domain-containing protein [Candidatus Neomarinimicrobiota bacterium]
MHFRPQYSWLSDDSGGLIPDFIGKFENLEQDLNTLSSRLSVSIENLSLINESNHDHYREYYDEETKHLVAEAYRKDIKLFNYRF